MTDAWTSCEEPNGRSASRTHPDGEVVVTQAKIERPADAVRRLLSTKVPVRDVYVASGLGRTRIILK